VNNRLALQRVTYLPKELAPGVLYVSNEYSVAGHLCACGCGNKVITPLGPAEWSFTETKGQPSLWPSIGNWQLPCRSHYIISAGQIKWAGQWNDAQILAGRRAEELRRQAYYAAKDRRVWRRLSRFVRALFRS
jgi:uncharacterized protein DUF6527